MKKIRRRGASKSSQTSKAPARPSPSAQDGKPPQAVMLDLLIGYWVSRMLHVAAKLALADRLARRPKTAKELAQAAGVHAQSLHRLMRALSSVGVFSELSGGRFELTPLGETLRSGVPGSMNGFALMMPEDYNWTAWTQLLYSVKTGAVAFETAFGSRIFEYLGRHPDLMEDFGRAMSSLSSIEAPAVAEAYDFTGVKKLVDVAGGHGSLLATILRKTPKLSGVLFDLAAVIEQARKEAHFKSRSIAARVEFAAGDYLEGVPKGADAYIMKYILHDLDDPRAVKLLQNCRRAMSRNGRVLVVDAVIPPGNDPGWGKLMDINMLVLTGGRERTRSEFARLFRSADLELARVVPTASPLCVVEGVPV